MSGIPAGAGQLLGKRLGKYEILALLALGGTAEIYLARIAGAAGFEKYVVVKCLHDHLADDTDFVKMFLDEARLAAHLDHSNIVQTMELGEHDSRYYMVMEFLAGLSLAMIVRRAGERLQSTRIPVPLVLNILAQASAGLHYAHEKAMNGKALNIVHRDISPQNLVISFEGVVKLVDFGIAKAELRETRTRSGTIKGKFAYMSPEQCVANNVDRRTDVFALGVIGHELLTGRRLFKRPSPYETYQAVMECDVKPPSVLDPALDPALDPVIMGALTRDRSDRYPNAEAFGDALLGYLHHRGIGSGPGDVSRFFDVHFAQEIDEHSSRMRELIAGRDISVDTGVSWGGDDGRDSDPSLAGAPSAGSSSELTAARRQSAGSLSLLLDDLGNGSRGEADDEMPAERTRIESNPMERVNELERLAAQGARAPADGPTQLAPSSAVPVPPPPPGVEASAQRAPAAKLPSSGRFPDAANLPTVIGGAGLLGLIPPPSPVAPQPATDPPAALPAHARTHIAGMPAPPPSGPPGASPESRSPNGALRSGPSRPPGPSARPHSASTPPGPPGPPAPGSPGPPGSPPPGPGLAMGYPVMNAELSAQIATGATVFPSESPRATGPHPGPPGSAMPAMQPGAAMSPGSGGHAMPFGSPPHPGPSPGGPVAPPSGPPVPGPRGSEPGAAFDPRDPAHGGGHGPALPEQHGDPGSLPWGMPVGGEPSAQHGEAGGSLPWGMPVGGEPGPRDATRGGGHGPAHGPALPAQHGDPGGSPLSFDPQRAAELMSPVGQQYPEQVDWSAMAAGRARALPPWMLAVLFVGAIGIALAITIIVARLIR
jgi:serine/threonine-protein kinase